MSGLAKDQLSVNDLAATVVASDPELRESLKALALDMVNGLRYSMAHGDLATRLALAKTMAPHLLRAMQNVEADEANKRGKEAYENILKYSRGELDTVPDPGTPSEDVPGMDAP